MPANLRIVNWNIQNYGETKSGLADIVAAIAKIVVSIRADIFVMLEVNTTKPAVANDICAIMQEALSDEATSRGRDEWDVCVRSPNTGLEFYAFFLRDNTATIPLTCRGPLANGQLPRSLGGALGPAISAGQFMADTGLGVRKYFPLIAPDLGYVSKKGRVQGQPPVWISRQPVLGLFWLPAATGANRLLPIVACHYAANHVQATAQIKALTSISLLRGLAPNPPGQVQNPISLQTRLTGEGAYSARTPNYYVLTGDYNINYNKYPGNYWRLTNGA
jgi:hypothetical protein